MQASKTDEVFVNSDTVPPEDVSAIVNRYNGFHDSFIRALEIESTDRYLSAASTDRIIGGEFKVRIEFSCPDFKVNVSRPTRIVEGTFSGVRSIIFDFRVVQGESCDWTIVSLNFEPEDDSRWSLRVIYNFLDSEKKWSERDVRLFSFSGVRFREFDRPEMIEPSK